MPPTSCRLRECLAFLSAFFRRRGKQNAGGLRAKPAAHRELSL